MNDEERQATSVDADKVIEDLRAKQSNIIWPDSLLNGRSVDEFLWKGSPNAPLVQRVGAMLFGSCFMLCGVIFIEADRETTPDRKSIFAVIAGVMFFLIGVKVFLNGFRRRSRPPQDDNEDDQQGLT